MSEKTVKDIEQQAADKALVKMFGDKTSLRKIAVLAESKEHSSFVPTTSIEDKFLPALETIMEGLGYIKYTERYKDEILYWRHPDTGRIVKPRGESASFWFDMPKDSTVEQYAEEATSRLLETTFRKLSPKQIMRIEKKLSPDIKENIEQFYKLVGTDLKKHGEKRDPTFIREAEWFKRYMSGEKVLYKHPSTGEVTEVQLPREQWAEVETFPFYGEETLKESGKKISEWAGEKPVSLGIFGHAGMRFGGVRVDKPAWQEAFQSTDIDTTFLGACSMTEKPEVCKVLSASLSDPEKEAVVVLAQTQPWGTSPGGAPEEPSLAGVAFQPWAGVEQFQATPELREKVGGDEWPFTSMPPDAIREPMRMLIEQMAQHREPMRMLIEQVAQQRRAQEGMERVFRPAGMSGRMR